VSRGQVLGNLLGMEVRVRGGHSSSSGHGPACREVIWGGKNHRKPTAASREVVGREGFGEKRREIDRGQVAELPDAGGDAWPVRVSERATKILKEEGLKGTAASSVQKSRNGG